MLHEIELRNVLSYGPEGQKLALKPLNVLIGPNGGGKSNLLDVFGFLKSLPSPDVSSLIAETGGIEAWLWKGNDGSPAEVAIGVSLPCTEHALSFRVSFGKTRGHFVVQAEELVANGLGASGKPWQVMQSSGREVTFGVRQEGGTTTRVSSGSVVANASVLAQYKDPDHHAELTALSNRLAGIGLYREWFFARTSPVRQPQKPDYPASYLMEDARNLGLVLNRLAGDADAKRRLIEALRQLYAGITDYHTPIEFGSVGIELREGRTTIPATRLSDGTMRYLCLLAVLCHPEPPSLVCIEEPEIGLHPDVIVEVADLLREASARCQLIVTTHSDVLVDALTDVPESIVVCEKPNGQTQLKRLNSNDLEAWLKDYRLGQLWTSGEIGGNRW